MAWMKYTAVYGHNDIISLRLDQKWETSGHTIKTNKEFTDAGYLIYGFAGLSIVIDRATSDSARLVAIIAKSDENEPAFQLGDRVQKIKGSSWVGHVVGKYSTDLTPEGYAVESEREPGSVQIYPASALRKILSEQDLSA